MRFQNIGSRGGVAIFSAIIGYLSSKITEIHTRLSDRSLGKIADQLDYLIGCFSETIRKH